MPGRDCPCLAVRRAAAERAAWWRAYLGAASRAWKKRSLEVRAPEPEALLQVAG